MLLYRATPSTNISTSVYLLIDGATIYVIVLSSPCARLNVYILVQLLISIYFVRERK